MASGYNWRKKIQRTASKREKVCREACGVGRGKNFSYFGRSGEREDNTVIIKKAIILLSGGLDSTTTLYLAKKKGYKCHALIFDYGQRHNKEVRFAVEVAKGAKVPFNVIQISLPWKGSSLLDKELRLPKARSKNIPSTYVPARNTIFISFALSFAETIGARAIFIGANAVDFSGYPDCRPTYYKAFNALIGKATKAKKIRILTPLINMSKSDIIRLARRIKAPIEKTWSCYAGGEKPCGACDSCRIREKGFKEAKA